MAKFERLSAWGCSLSCLAFLSGCEPQKTEPPAQASAPQAAAQQAAPPAGSPTVQPAGTAGKSEPAAEIVWTMPAAWKEMPQRAMRKATYQVPGAAGPAEVAVFYFGVGQGGDLEANIGRWIRQFQDLPEGSARRDQLQVKGFTVSTVRVARGAFLSGMPGGPTEAQKDWGMNAAVVETPQGPYFFKMTGPGATVDAEEARFGELLQSVRAGS